MSDPEDDDALHLLEMIAGGWTSQAIYVAARLGVADQLAGGPRTCEELAGDVGAHPPALRRLVRALASLGLCVERSDGRIELTALGSGLRADVPHSVRATAIHWGTSLWPIWATLLHAVKTGRALRPLATGQDGFARLAANPEAAGIFGAAMADIARLVSARIVRDYDFRGIDRLIDVGGGHGALLVEILRAHPAMRGVLFDLPHAVEGARERLEAAGVGSRCEIVAGSFFDAVPGVHDACLLKSVVHDWDDDRALRILAGCRRALPTGGRLLIVERVLPDAVRPGADHRRMMASDLNMLVAMSGRERTDAEYRTLLTAAGFTLTRIVPVGASFSLIEGLGA